MTRTPRLPGLAARLRHVREALGLDQGRLARQLGTSRLSVNRYERGHRLPSTRVLIRLAQLGGVTLDWLEGRDVDGVGDGGGRGTRGDATGLGLRIAQIRNGLALTQRQFGRRLGVNRNSVSLYERGRTPRSHVLDRIARLGGVT